MSKTLESQCFFAFVGYFSLKVVPAVHAVKTGPTSDRQQEGTEITEVRCGGFRAKTLFPLRPPVERKWVRKFEHPDFGLGNVLLVHSACCAAEETLRECNPG